MPLNVIPYPSGVVWSPQMCSLFRLESSFAGLSMLSAALPAVYARFATRLQATSSAIALSSSGLPVDSVVRTMTFQLNWTHTIQVPQHGDDESYKLALTVRSSSVLVRIDAATSTGLVRGLSLLLQLAADRRQCIPVGFFVSDQPSFPWRGLMVDVARRFHPIDQLMRVCDALEFSRMNVLHLHLTDDQGWRFQSLLWPRLTQVSNYDGLFYTQANLTALVKYCAAGGVRVVPEINTPGHSAAALLAYPSLAPDHFPNSFVTDWGVHDYVLDPSSPTVGQFVRDIITEVSNVFSDAYIHVGGDEVTWPTPTSTRQQAWMSARNLTTATLQRYFQNNITFPALASRGRRGIGWTEIFTAAGSHASGLPNATAVQWWSSASLSFDTLNIVSTGFYMNFLPDSTELYSSNYLGHADVGGEACLWSELIGSNLESRVFPTILALAEVLWSGLSGRTTVESMLYRTFVQHYDGLQMIGLYHHRVYLNQVHALATNTSWSLEALQPAAVLVNKINTSIFDVLLPSYFLVSPLNVPLNDVLDAVRPDSPSCQMLVWLAEMCTTKEKMDPLKPATQALTEFFVDIMAIEKSSVNAKLGTILSGLQLTARNYLDWMVTVQSNKDGSLSRLAALGSGDIFFPGIDVQAKFVYNQFKIALDPVLLNEDLGPFRYLDPFATELIPSTISTTTGPSQPGVVADAGLIAGLTVGLVLLLAVCVTVVVVFAVQRKKRKDSLLKATWAVTEMSAPADFYSQDSSPQKLDKDLGDSYVSYMMGDEEEETDSIMAERGNTFEFSTESVSSTATTGPVDVIASIPQSPAMPQSPLSMMERTEQISSTDVSFSTADDEDSQILFEDESVYDYL